MMRELWVRGKEFDSLVEVHDFLKSQLDFPEHYGKNLSALYDCLTDIGEDTRIVIDWEQVEEDELLDGLERIAEVMQDAQEENEYLEIAIAQDDL